jgi:hypothetical protein
MIALAADTLRQALRSPGPWVLLAVGALVGVLGLDLAVLALGAAEAQSAELALATSLTTATLATLWVLGRALDEDRRSPLVRSVDAAVPGVGGRLLGRWAGAVLAGSLVGACLLGLLLGLGGQAWPGPGYLYVAIVSAELLVGAWGLLLARSGSGTTALLAGALLWMLGHLPWGSPGLLPGLAGRTLGTLLPGPHVAERGVAGVAAALLSVLGLLLLAAAPRGGAAAPR